MLDIAFLLAFALLPIAIWGVSRSVVFATVGLILGFGIAGNLVQTLITLGVSWNVRGLQVLVLVVMVVLLVLARVRAWAADGSLRWQFVSVGIPALAIGAVLIVIRLMAPEDPGALSAIGYFINHPMAEDNAKWLHLSAQIADGRSISFNGYAGGPLLLMMATFSPLIAVLSMIFLGGVNQVAVAANTVLAVQFFLIAAVPFALVPFVNGRRSAAGTLRQVPVAALWLGAAVLALASAVVTSYGHISQQFTFIVLALWIAAFLAGASRWVLLATSLIVATSVSVWVPLNVLGFAILVTAVVLTVRARWWAGLGLTMVTAVVAFDAIVSSIVYLLGIQVRLPVPGLEGLGGLVGGDDGGSGALVPSEPGELIASAHLFRAPGATEQTSSVLALLAVTVALASAWFLVKKLGVEGPRAAWALAPIGILLGYTLLTTVADALVTGSAPNYGAIKMAFTVIVAIVAAGTPLAVMAIDPDADGMSVLRWSAGSAVIAVLLLDSLVPRAFSALSPLLWKGVDPAAPVYWSAAEVRDDGDQPIAEGPIACLFAPPESSEPTALPLGQESYSCTRLLIGLSGEEGAANLIGDWLLTDWQSQSQNWAQFRDSIELINPDLLGRSVILMRGDGTLAGLTTLGDLIDKNPLPS